MLLTLSTTADQPSDLGYLLHKHPARLNEAKAWFGQIYVFFPECSETRCTAALLLDVDPIHLVRGRTRGTGVDQYVNDRPYVASSFVSVAIAHVLSTALNGHCKERPQRVDELLPLEITISAVACAAGPTLIESLFQPLGYAVAVQAPLLDERFPQWGPAPVYSVQLQGQQTVCQALRHLYVLLPVLDNAKHYYVAADEIDKLLDKGEKWLAAHPMRELITKRYLSYRKHMVTEALERLRPLTDEDEADPTEQDEKRNEEEQTSERKIGLNQRRLEAVTEAVKSLLPAARRVLDLGCGEGRLVSRLLKERIAEVVGVDVSSRALGYARRDAEKMPEHQRRRLQLLQGSLVYRDNRFADFDVITLVEVIEHLDPWRLPALERVVFEHARPRRVVVTTPNIEYNRKWPSMESRRFRHRDHRFEWNRAEFNDWAQSVAQSFGWTVDISGIGDVDDELGTPTQMAVFDR
jgi:3' terminal RNA ribose 2'-O-methyltransferase Hen1